MFTASVQADIENLEKCPFCDYAMIIENTEDRIFRCLNKEVSDLLYCLSWSVWRMNLPAVHEGKL